MRSQEAVEPVRHYFLQQTVAAKNLQSLREPEQRSNPHRARFERVVDPRHFDGVIGFRSKAVLDIAAAPEAVSAPGCCGERGISGASLISSVAT
jgi:hypothetical protein